MRQEFYFFIGVSQLWENLTLNDLLGIFTVCLLPFKEDRILMNVARFYLIITWIPDLLKHASPLRF